MSFWCLQYPITSIPKASWGGGMRLAVFDLENGCRGDQLNLYIYVYKDGYLTILEPLPSPFSSRVCLSRQVFCAHEYLDKNYIFRGLSLFAAILQFFGLLCRYSKISAFNSNRSKSTWQVKIYYAKQDLLRQAPAEHHGALWSVFILNGLWKHNERMKGKYNIIFATKTPANILQIPANTRKRPQNLKNPHFHDLLFSN